MAIVAGKILQSKKHIRIALTYIYGIGPTRAVLICKSAGVDASLKVQDLTNSQLDFIRQEVAKFVIEGELRRQVTSNIKNKMEIGSYQGIRHRRGLPVHGQRTKTNAKTAKKRKKRS